jgi:hypothetical protein
LPYEEPPYKKSLYENIETKSEDETEHENNDEHSIDDAPDNYVRENNMYCNMNICGGGNNTGDDIIKNYLNEYVYNGNTQCAPTGNVDPNKFRKNYFYFDNKINVNSNDTGDGDVVDKLNEMYLAENTDVNENNNGYDDDDVNNNGKKIKDIFDNLTRHDNPGCVREPVVDKTSMSSYYVQQGTGGNYVVDSLRIYENDGVENGGVFIPEGNVYGYDGSGEKPMFIQ